MPTESGFVLTHPVGGPVHYLSNVTDMRDGVPFRFTTGYATLKSEVPSDSTLVGVVDIVAYTNRRVGAGVSVSMATMTLVVQAAIGDPTQADSAWFDIATFPTIRPFVPLSSTGANTPQNPVFSNRYRLGIQTPYTNLRFSGQFHGPNPDFSRTYMAIHPGTRRSRELQ